MSQIAAIVALLLFVPAFSIGVIMALFIAPGAIGNAVFTAIKVWVVIFPWWWTWKTRPSALRLPEFDWQEIKVGLGLGGLMFAAIALAYYLVGREAIDIAALKAKALEVGIVSPYLYLAGCFYWSFVNSLIEECTWRGFVVSQCQILAPKAIAIVLSALFFTTHHSIALYGYTHSWLVVFLGSLGVFLAGIIWAWCYSYYRSLVPGYISHILTDLAIAIVGWQLLFT